MTQLMTARKLSKSEMQAVQGGGFWSWLTDIVGSTTATEPNPIPGHYRWTVDEDGNPELRPKSPKAEVQQNPDGTGCTGKNLPV